MAARTTAPTPPYAAGLPAHGPDVGHARSDKEVTRPMAARAIRHARRVHCGVPPLRANIAHGPRATTARTRPPGRRRTPRLLAPSASLHTPVEPGTTPSHQRTRADVNLPGPCRADDNDRGFADKTGAVAGPMVRCVVGKRTASPVPAYPLRLPPTVRAPDVVAKSPPPPFSHRVPPSVATSTPVLSTGKVPRQASALCSVGTPQTHRPEHATRRHATTGSSAPPRLIQPPITHRPPPLQNTPLYCGSG